MDATTQLRLVMEEIEKARKRGNDLSIDQAQRKLHRDYIVGQLWNKHGLRPAGFLVVSGLCDTDEEGGKTPDQKLYDMFNRFLNMKSKLTSDDGMRLRQAMDELGIDYLYSPTWPLEPMKTGAA
jgi:hypothetical protein